ncbi:MAG: hypothetical protein HOB69_07630 [Flavobacterium sp.]|jgi:hypothetical protein|nr:hypothetical protein [Flavobacterium sp.]
MEIKVKDLGLVEEKSRAEVEEQLLKKHEEKFEETPQQEQVVEKVNTNEPVQENKTEPVEDKTPSLELNDDNVLSYIKDRYNKDINSVDELFAEKEANEPLPDDVSAYLKYKKETGRNIQDFYNLQKDYDSMDDNSVLANYYSNTEEGLDAIDIQDIIEDKFDFDEDIDEPKDIKKIKLAKKRELAKAKKFLNEQKDKYKIPLESSGDGLSADQQENLNAYKSYIDESKTAQEQNKKRYDYFLNKTNEVFNNEFKGFDFKVGENNFTYKPGTADEVKNVQKDIGNFINKYTDEKGLMSDAKGYHKALSVAMNPDKFAQYFYEQGVSNAVDNVTRKSKNINMDMRQAPQTVSKDGMKIRPVGNTDSGRGLRIRSIKKS